MAEPHAVLSGRSSFAIADCSTGTIQLRFTADQDRPPLAVRTGDIAAEMGSRAPVTWSIDWDKPSAVDPAIKEYQSAGRIRDGCPTATVYRVPLTIVWDKGEQTTLTITVTRADEPVLDAPIAVTLALESWPFGIHSSHPRLAGIQLRETSHGAGLSPLTASGSELKTAANEFTGIMLVPGAGPLAVPAGGAADLEVRLSRTPDPGTYTGRLVLHSPALKQNATIDVTYKVRIYWYFLLVAIAIGVGLGWFVNVYLTKRAALDTAMLDALRAAQAIAGRATLQRDPSVQQRVMAAVAKLHSDLRSTTAVPQIQAAVTEAQNIISQIEARATEAATKLQQSVAETVSQLHPNGQPPDDVIAGQLAPILDELEGIRRGSEAGDVEMTQRRLDDFRQTMPHRTVESIREWLSEVRADLDEFGPWTPADLEPEKTRAELQNGLPNAYGTTESGQIVQQADAIARKLRGWAVMTAPLAMAQALRATAGVLRGAYSDLVTALATTAEDAVRGAGGQEPLARLKSLAALRRQAEAAIRTAASGKVALDDELEKGDFRAAAQKLAGAVEVRGADTGGPQPPIALAPLMREQTPLGPPPELTPAAPRLLVLPLIPVGQTTTLRLDWAGERVPNSNPNWTCDPATAASFGNATVENAEITPSEAGFLTITAAVGGIARATALTYAGQASATSDYTRITKEANLANRWIGGIAAVITMFAGYEIFIGNWYGTFGDFFAAFLWGFFGQFGLDRIRELARPITSRPLP